MNRPIPVMTALLAVALTAPAATATWSAYGSFEPDNALDTEQFMFSSPAPAGVKRIYFAAFTTNGGLANANVASLQTSMEAITLEYHMAVLGVWTDCNGDGYVGQLEGALYEYGNELLLDDSICPAATGSGNGWDGSNNYNGWVSEFIPVGGVDPDPADDQRDRRVYRDAEAMVWGDYGRPTDGASAGGTCALNPLPRGTLASTGGMINYIGCPYPGVSGRYNEIILGRDLMGLEYPGLDPSNSLGLAIERDQYGQLDARGHPILDQQTLGSEDSSGAAVSVVDCDAGPMFHSGDFFNDTPLGPSIPAAFQNDTIATIDPTPTGTGNPGAAGQVNQTNEEVFEDCDTSNDAGHDTYGLLEGDFNGVSTARKTEADWNFQFDDSPRGSPFGSVIGANGDAGTDNFAGVSPVQMAAGFLLADQLPSMWQSDSQLVKRGPRTATVNTYTGAVDIPNPPYFTFYAHVGAATKAKGFGLPGGVGAYGAAQCGENDSGVHNGWECDTSFWYLNPDGTVVPETYPFARPGQAYELRDVDCSDGAIGDTGVGAGTPYYGPNPCP